MTAWDVFLDPQMVEAGHWRWADPTPALPGVPGVPLSNYAGWLVVGLAMMALLRVVLPASSAAAPDELVPAALLTWTWVGYILGNLFWFGRPSTAAAGGVALGALVVPYLARLRRALR